ncbi:MAG: YXWGXW repeat-containing protein [Limisphaerales bacterium]
MKTITWTRLVSLAAGLALFAGCATQQAPPQGPEAPPPPESEVIPPQPNMTFVWTPGYWDWRGRWVWAHGYWGPRLHPGAIWIRGHWFYRGHHRYWMRPHWQ